MVSISVVQGVNNVTNFDANLEFIAKVCHKAATSDIIIFPELFLSGYIPKDILSTPDFQRAHEHALARLLELSSRYDAHLLVGCVGFQEGGRFNSAVHIVKGQIVGWYHKRMLPVDDIFDEQRHFQAGSEAYYFSLKGCNFAVLLCEDVWHHEIVAKNTQYADVLLVLNASPYESDKLAQRLRVLEKVSGQAIVYCNTVGADDDVVFDGNSLLLSPNGTVAARLPHFYSGLQTFSYQNQDWRQDGPFYPLGCAVKFPLWLEQDLAQQTGVNAKDPERQRLAWDYAALLCGVQNYILKSGFKKVLLGLSGGVDSALVLALACDAVGAENVRALVMPSRYTSQISLEDADILQRHFGHQQDIIDIETAIEAFYQPFSKVIEPVKEITAQNLQARMRALYLMALANQEGALLLTTSNKSEAAVGYCTLYGDTCGAYAPLIDVFKTHVYALCNYRNSLASEQIPERILVRPPSAELAPDQKDSDSLPEYHDLDAILDVLLNQRGGQEELVNAGYSRDLVLRIQKMIALSEYKRWQMAPGCKISAQCFGRGRRIPVSRNFFEGSGQ